MASRWNGDPVLALAIGLAIGGAIVAASGRRRMALLLAIGALIAALVSPLCALSVSLFAAREAQHMILTLVAAPLLALGAPSSSRPRPMVAALVFAAITWMWRAPSLYAATFDGPVVYWAMHISTLAAAFWLWRDLMASASLSALAAAVATALQMAVLGAVLTLAASPIYAPHFATSAIWGLSALDDQRLGGLLLWVLGGGVFFAAAAANTLHLLREAAPPHRRAHA